MNDIISWLAPIVSALVICAGQLALNSRFKKADEKRDKARMDTEEARKAEDEWKQQIVTRLDTQDQKIDNLLTSQCSQIRSDIIHKSHRYLDDLNCASTEEKQAIHAEYEDYMRLCSTANVENHFIDVLVSRVMELPERSFSKIA